MRRLTANLLVLVLLAGICAPFAAAGAMQQAGAHCLRKPLAPVRVSDVPNCHQHHMAGAEQLPARNSSAPAMRSNPCCNGHECCRSSVRSRWAHASFASHVRIVAQAEGLYAPRLVPLHSSESLARQPARAPPAL